MKRNAMRSILLSCVILMMTGVMVIFCSISEAPAKEPIKIGYIGALSTPYGQSSKASLEISVEEINKAGGILGRPVELITEDWKREVPLAVAAYKKLVMKDRCLLVFTEGTEGSMACAQVASRLYSSYPHLMFTNWVQGLQITDLVANEYNKYKFLFRVYAKSSDAFDPKLKTLEIFTDMIGSKKVALVIEDIGWTELYRIGKPGISPSQKEFFEKNGVKVVFYTTSDVKEKMFLPIFEKIAASGADTIYGIIAYSDSVTFVKQWAQSAAKDLDVVLQSGEGSYAAFWKMTGGLSLGVTVASPQIIIPFTRVTHPFMDKLKAKGAGYCGATPGAYDGPWILKGAVEKVGSIDVEKMIKAIEGGEFQRGFHLWAFDKQHDPKKGYPYMPSFVWGQFQQDGQYVLVCPDELRKLTHPKNKFLHVKELRKRASQ